MLIMDTLKYNYYFQSWTDFIEIHWDGACQENVEGNVRHKFLINHCLPGHSDKC